MLPIAFTSTSYHLRYYTSLVITSLLFHVSVSNTLASITLLSTSPRRIILILNLVQSLFPMMVGGLFMLRKWAPWMVSCSMVGVAETAVLIGGDPTMFILLLIKAYFVTNKSLIVMLSGAMLVMIEVVIGVLMHYARTVVASGEMAESEGWSTRCDIRLSSSWISINLVTDIATNIFLSFVFLRSIWNHRKLFRNNKVYDVLVRDGLVYAITIPLSNLLTAYIAYRFPIWSGHVYAADYILASTLLVCQFQNGEKVRERRRRAVEEWERVERVKRGVRRRKKRMKGVKRHESSVDGKREHEMGVTMGRRRSSTVAFLAPATATTSMESNHIPSIAVQSPTNPRKNVHPPPSLHLNLTYSSYDVLRQRRKPSLAESFREWIRRDSTWKETEPSSPESMNGGTLSDDERVDTRQLELDLEKALSVLIDENLASSVESKRPSSRYSTSHDYDAGVWSAQSYVEDQSKHAMVYPQCPWKRSIDNDHDVYIPGESPIPSPALETTHYGTTSSRWSTPRDDTIGSRQRRRVTVSSVNVSSVAQEQPRSLYRISEIRNEDGVDGARRSAELASPRWRITDTAMTTPTTKTSATLVSPR